MHPELAAWLAEIELRAREAADPVRAVGERAYLKSELTFLGTGVPWLRTTAKAFRKRFPTVARADLLELVAALWAPPVHEFRSLAIAVLEVQVDRLDPEDLRTVEAMLRDCDTWAHVDWLAPRVAGPLIARHPAGAELLLRWNADPWMWLRRASLLALLIPLREGRGDFALFARLAVPLLPEREFFIRKAIGWVLRDVARSTPERAQSFVAEHLDRMSGLTFREATRRLPPGPRQELEAAYRARRPARGARPVPGPLPAPAP